MNDRKLYRAYAQSKGKDAKEFVKIEEGWYNQDTLITKDNNGNEERTSINYKDLVIWLNGSLPSEEEMRDGAEEWVFDINAKKWSNNDNTVGDNYGSFIAGAKWVLRRLSNDHKLNH